MTSITKKPCREIIDLLAIYTYDFNRINPAITAINVVATRKLLVDLYRSVMKTTYEPNLMQQLVLAEIIGISRFVEDDVIRHRFQHQCILDIGEFDESFLEQYYPEKMHRYMLYDREHGVSYDALIYNTIYIGWSLNFDMLNYVSIVYGINANTDAAIRLFMRKPSTHDAEYAGGGGGRDVVYNIDMFTSTMQFAKHRQPKHFVGNLRNVDHSRLLNSYISYTRILREAIEKHPTLTSNRHTDYATYANMDIPSPVYKFSSFDPITSKRRDPKIYGRVSGFWNYSGLIFRIFTKILRVCTIPNPIMYYSQVRDIYIHISIIVKINSLLRSIDKKFDAACMNLLYSAGNLLYDGYGSATANTFKHMMKDLVSLAETTDGSEYNLIFSEERDVLEAITVTDSPVIEKVNKTFTVHPCFSATTSDLDVCKYRISNIGEDYDNDSSNHAIWHDMITVE